MAETTTGDNTLQAIVSGGLNTVSSALILPREDTPNCMNVDVNIDGTVTKRRGSEKESFGYLGTENIDAMVPVRLRNGETAYIFKNGYDMAAKYKKADGTFSTITHANVWSDKAYYVKPDYYVSYEPLYTRCIFTTGVNVPIQGTFVEAESQSTWNPGAPSSVAVMQMPLMFVYSHNQQASVWAWVTNTATGVTTFTTLSALTVTTTGLATMTFSTVFASGSYRVFAAWFSWQWWGEAMKLEGLQIVQSVATNTSQKVYAVPAMLLRDIKNLSISYRRYPMILYQSGNFDNVYSLVAPPATAVQYRWDSGGQNLGAVENVPSPYYIQLGAAPAAAGTIIFHRGYKLPFMAGIGTQLQFLTVAALNTTTNWNYINLEPPSEGGVSVGGPQFSFHGRNTAFVVEVTVTDTVEYVTFDGTATASGGIGIPQDDTYFIAIDNPFELKTVGNAYVGSSATSTGSTNTLSGGSWIINQGAYAVFGISDYCDYKYGSFPRTITVVQGRLVLGGFPFAPNRLAVSALNDNVVPGRYYDNFQTTLENGVVTDAFDLILNGGLDDTITCIREFQGDLFVWTRYRTYRITDIQPGGGNVSTIGEVGAVNNRSVSLAKDTVYFLDQTGVHRIVPTDSADNYTTQEVSLKIRNRVQKQRIGMEAAAWTAWDGFESRLYVGMPDNQVGSACADLYVYHAHRDAWTQYSDASGRYWHTTGGTTVNISPNNVQFYLWCGPVNGNLDHTIIRLKETVPMDTYNSASGPGSPNITAPIKQIRFICTNGIFEYDPSIRVGTLADWSAFALVPITNYQDVVCYYNGSLLTFGTDYVKTDRGNIQLAFNPATGAQLDVIHAANWGENLYHPIAFSVNHDVFPLSDIVGLSEPPTYLSVLPLGTSLNPTPSGTVRVGNLYPTWIYSPIFALNTLENWKRISHYIGFYATPEQHWAAAEVGTRYDLIGLPKNRSNFDLCVLFNDEQMGHVDTEVYGSSALHWDQSQLSHIHKTYERIVIPIIGGGYDMQFVHYSFSPTTFQLSGYQLKAILKPGKGTPRGGY